MKTVKVFASKEYEVLVGAGLLNEAGERLRAVTKAACAVIVSDDNVFPLYGARVKDSLEAVGFKVLNYVVPHGESSKSLQVYGELLSFLSGNHVNRGDVLIALGGGVVGDLTGFAASTYQRGMDFVQLPTTLLAAVDSSVGGKTAVNLPTGKNQVGTFYQPSLVLCDPETLHTLPDEEYRCGCAEVIKYGVLGNARFFKELNETPAIDQIEHVITTCVEMKRDIVGKDEFDRGLRQLLNLGHSVGHAVEACSGFTVLHGHAVAIGMAVITRASYEKGMCSRDTLDAVLEILEKYKLPTKAEYSLKVMSQAALADKKLSGGVLRLIVPREIGKCDIVPIPAEEISDWMRAGGVV